MALRHAVLAALLDGEATGYELSKRFDISVANFWPATSQQIYRELDRLESDGHLSGRLVEQDRRPNKRVFTITGEGRKELAGFIERPGKPTAIRDDLLVKVVALDRTNRESVGRAVQERLTLSESKLAQYHELRELALGGDSRADYLERTERIGTYLALERGISFEEDNCRWCREVLDLLDLPGPG